MPDLQSYYELKCYRTSGLLFFLLVFLSEQTRTSVCPTANAVKFTIASNEIRGKKTTRGNTTANAVEFLECWLIFILAHQNII